MLSQSAVSHSVQVNHFLSTPAVPNPNQTADRSNINIKQTETVGTVLTTGIALVGNYQFDVWRQKKSECLLNYYQCFIHKEQQYTMNCL